MSCVYLFADEAGDFKFRSDGSASRYFILCTLRAACCDVGGDLSDLRRRMLLKGVELRDGFHAVDDPWPIRNEVYNLLRQHDFRVDCTILEKRKAQPQTRIDEATFYRYAWFYHAQYLIPLRANRGQDLLITAAALGNKKKAAFKTAFNNVIQQTTRNPTWATDFRPSACDPCLQAADYCAWAIQRKWERADEGPYNAIREKVGSEFDLWRHGQVTYY